MPDGVSVSVVDGVATVEFSDQSVRGRVLAQLLNVCGPGSVRKVTRPRVAYIVSEDVARAAGLLREETGSSDDTVLAVPESAPTDDDGSPDMGWSRRALNDHAARLNPPLDTTDLPNKRAVIAAIDAAVQAGSRRPE